MTWDVLWDVGQSHTDPVFLYTRECPLSVRNSRSERIWGSGPVGRNRGSVWDSPTTSHNFGGPSWPHASPSSSTSPTRPTGPSPSRPRAPAAATTTAGLSPAARPRGGSAPRAEALEPAQRLPAPPGPVGAHRRPFEDPVPPGGGAARKERKDMTDRSAATDDVTPRHLLFRSSDGDNSNAPGRAGQNLQLPSAFDSARPDFSLSGSIAKSLRDAKCRPSAATCRWPSLIGAEMSAVGRGSR
jgi:hypothetical protein